MRAYKVLSKQTFENGKYKLVPIRQEDRLQIMKWRNEQIYHLRQKEPLTIEKQDRYFNTTIASIFNEEEPGQILFSFLQGNECIGYGGLVHISWIDKHAELSFVMATDLEKECFKFLWSKFLAIIEVVAFEELCLHKIFTYAYDLRPNLYYILEENGYKKEAVLKDHCQITGVYKDVIIHSLLNKQIKLRTAESRDIDITFTWANNAKIRKYFLTNNKITRESHKKWFSRKHVDPNCLYYIAEKQNDPIGSFRLDINPDGSGYVSYLLDPEYHGNGYGRELLRLGIRIAKENSNITSIIGDVMIENLASIKIFEGLGFIKTKKKNHIRYKLITE